MREEITDIIFSFEGEEARRLDKDHILKRLNELRTDLMSASKCKSYVEGECFFSLNFLMADILECLDMLSFNSLSQVIGRDLAARIWLDVKR